MKEHSRPDAGLETAPQNEKFGEEQALINLGTETTDKSIFRDKDVTDKDILALAKKILLFCFFLFVIIALVRGIFPDSKGAQDVWDFSKVAINSIVSLVLGLYFGGARKANNN